MLLPTWSLGERKASTLSASPQLAKTLLWSENTFCFQNTSRRLHPGPGLQQENLAFMLLLCSQELGLLAAANVWSPHAARLDWLNCGVMAKNSPWEINLLNPGAVRKRGIQMTEPPAHFKRNNKWTETGYLKWQTYLLGSISSCPGPKLGTAKVGAHRLCAAATSFTFLIQ